MKAQTASESASDAVWGTIDLPRHAPLFLGQDHVPVVMSSDAWAQYCWLLEQARARGFHDIGTLAATQPDVFDQLASAWRQQHPVVEI